MKKLLRGITSLVLAVILCITAGQTAFAQNAAGEKVTVTEELAIHMAQNFADGLCEKVTADNPIKFYDSTGQAIGYIVNFYRDDQPSGYVVFDSTDESLISEYSFGENAKNPYEAVLCHNNVSLLRQENPKLYLVSPFTYGIIDETSQTIVTNYGETQDLNAMAFDLGRSPKPTTWNDVLLEVNDVYHSVYQITASNHIEEFISFPEADIEAQTKHYACAVSALTACAAYYGTLNWNNIAADYEMLWRNTGTEIKRIENGITYGGTDEYRIGPGFVEFCFQKGKNISEKTVDNPSYSFFTNCIDSRNVGVVSCGIIDSRDDSYSGHSMAVEGYATIRNKTNGSQLQTLQVSDGWYSQVRFLNLNFGSYVDMEGTAFHG